MSKKETKVETRVEAPAAPKVEAPALCQSCRFANKRELQAGRDFCLVGTDAGTPEASAPTGKKASGGKCDTFEPNVT